MQSLLVLLALALAVNSLGRRLVPLAMPKSRLRTVALAFVGGGLGSWLDSLTLGLGPHVLSVNLGAAILGAALFVLALGISPFVKILLGRG